MGFQFDFTEFPDLIEMIDYHKELETAVCYLRLFTLILDHLQISSQWQASILYQMEIITFSVAIYLIITPPPQVYKIEFSQ